MHNHEQEKHKKETAIYSVLGAILFSMFFGVWGIQLFKADIIDYLSQINGYKLLFFTCFSIALIYVFQLVIRMCIEAIKVRGEFDGERYE